MVRALACAIAICLFFWLVATSLAADVRAASELRKNSTHVELLSPRPLADCDLSPPLEKWRVDFCGHEIMVLRSRHDSDVLRFMWAQDPHQDALRYTICGHTYLHLARRESIYPYLADFMDSMRERGYCQPVGAAFDRQPILPSPPTHMLMLGLGGGAFPMIWRSQCADSIHRLDVIDISDESLLVARAFVQPDDGVALRYLHADAHDFVMKAAPGSYDIIVNDVFINTDYSDELRSLAFTKRVYETLRPACSLSDINNTNHSITNSSCSCSSSMPHCQCPTSTSSSPSSSPPSSTSFASLTDCLTAVQAQSPFERARGLYVFDMVSVTKSPEQSPLFAEQMFYLQKVFGAANVGVRRVGKTANWWIYASRLI